NFYQVYLRIKHLALLLLIELAPLFAGSFVRQAQKLNVGDDTLAARLGEDLDKVLVHHIVRHAHYNGCRRRLSNGRSAFGSTKGLSFARWMEHINIWTNATVGRFNPDARSHAGVVRRRQTCIQEIAEPIDKALVQIREYRRIFKIRIHADKRG